MLEVVVPGTDDYFDEVRQEFIYVPEQKLQLEHSLVSIAKWEAKWHKPYFNDSKTPEEVLDYVRCMTINKNVDQTCYHRLTEDIAKQITDYIADEHTATWFSDENKKNFVKKGGRGGQVITSEIIYYWMVAFQIPVEFEKWHINRLITLIRVCEEKNQPPKKMSKRDILSKNRALNAARRARLGSKG